jgi:transketolase
MDRLLKLKKRLIEIKYNQKENHIGSCLTALPIIEKIYKKMGKEDKFILSAGHAGVALYVVLEELGILPRDVIEKLESHPKRNEDYGIWASTGSLGHGIGIAVGMALTGIQVYCLLTDGECAEGSVWEALAVAESENLSNLHIVINANGWGGMDDIDIDKLKERLKTYNLDIKVIRTNSDLKPYLYGLEAHYKSLTKEEYEEIIRRRTI